MLVKYGFLTRVNDFRRIVLRRILYALSAQIYVSL